MPTSTAIGIANPGWQRDHAIVPRTSRENRLSTGSWRLLPLPGGIVGLFLVRV